MVPPLRGISMVKSMGEAETGALGTLIIPVESAELNHQSLAFLGDSR
ncbi:MAG: hypothetical protein FGF48_06200 [Candidatus Brockarchaeota archaeon]|nr:hypothetical protein [Candidatus Brockarchaeota archaeon]